jgi:hypothetical protein
VIVAGSRKFISASFNSEQELEEVVQANAEYIFGPDCLYLPKSVIRTFDGFGTIPDGFVVDLVSRRWFIVEAELAAHSVWNHIAPQVAKQIIAASQPASRQKLIESVVNRVKENSSLKEKFEELGIDDIDIRRILSEIFEGRPIVGMPIDHVGEDLRQWAQTLKIEVKLWLVRKLVEFGHPENVIYDIPDEFNPVLETSPDTLSVEGEVRYYDVSIADLVAAHLLAPNEKLYLAYKPRGGDRREFEATVTSDGSIEVLGESFTAPSYAALLCIKNAGSDRETVNGWTSWKTASARTLADLRTELLERQTSFDEGHKTITS